MTDHPTPPDLTTLREVIARAIEAGNSRQHGLTWGDCQARADAALAALAQAGVALVPVEPDGKMVNEGAIAVLDHRLERKHQSRYPTSTGGEVFAAYRAMISASPFAPKPAAYRD